MPSDPAADAPIWTGPALTDLLGDARIVARDGSAVPVAVPEALSRFTDGGAPTWNDHVAAVHPEDRVATVRAWWDALATPGHPVEAHTRYRAGGRWARRRVVIIDLRHQPDLGVVVVGIEELGPGAPAGPDEPPPPDVASWDAPVWIVQHLDALGTIQHTEGRVAELFGRSADELAGSNILDSLHPDDHPAALAMWMEVIDSPGQTRTIRQRVVRADGSSVWLDSTVTNRLGDDGSGSVVAVSHDISRQLAEEAALRASREELRILAEEVPVAVFRAEPGGRITYGNARFFGLFGVDGPVEHLLELAHPDDADELARALDEAVDPSMPGQADLEVRATDGRRRFSITWRRADSDGQPEALLGVLTDVTDAVELRRRAAEDELTGLLNRRGLEDHLAERLESGGAVIAFVDLDGFKAVNDELGHHVGDAVLAELGARLGALGDVVAGRWGGDEFVVVVPAGAVGPAADPSVVLDELGAAVTARIDALLVEPIVVGDTSWQPSASVGVAAGRAGDAPADLLRRADAAMYARKRARRHG